MIWTVGPIAGINQQIGWLNITVHEAVGVCGV